MEENAWCLCTWCHRETHADPMEYVMLIRDTIGDRRYRRLRAYAKENVGRKFDWYTERERLKELDTDG